MKHAALTDEVAARAGLYALGALTQIEARAFEEHLAEGCEVCQGELDAYQFTVGAMAVAGPDEEPAPAVRQRLLESLAGEPSAGNAPAGAADEPGPLSPPPLLSLHVGEGGWEQWGEGIFLKPLYLDKGSGLMTSLVRMLPGMSLPPHRHVGTEQFLIIEGDCNVNGEWLGPGDYHRALGGSVHETTYTEHGTTFLLIAPREYRFLEFR